MWSTGNNRKNERRVKIMKKPIVSEQLNYTMTHANRQDMTVNLFSIGHELKRKNTFMIEPDRLNQ